MTTKQSCNVDYFAEQVPSIRGVSYVLFLTSPRQFSLHDLIDLTT